MPLFSWGDKKNVGGGGGGNLKELAQLYIQHMNDHDIQAVMTLTDNDHCIVQTKGAKMTLEMYLQETQNIFDAFPDFTVTYKSIDNKIALAHGDHLIAIRGVVVAGTHTGKAFGFGPYKKVEISGIRAQNDPEVVKLVFAPSGKIKEVILESDGTLTGPIGLYKQIGGFQGSTSN